MTTLDILKTDQEVFNKIKTHLLAQGDKCLAATGEDCSYFGFKASDNEKAHDIMGLSSNSAFFYDEQDERNEDYDNYMERLHAVLFEIKAPLANCAIGCLMKEAHYDESFEGQTISSEDIRISVAQSNPNWEITEPSLEMLTICQTIHDLFMPDQWFDILDYLTDSFDEEGNWNKTYDTSSTMTLRKTLSKQVFDLDMTADD